MDAVLDKAFFTGLDDYQSRLETAANPVGAGIVLYPGARYRPIASHGGAMSEQCGNVIHITTMHADPYGYFSNTNNGASSTFWIGETIIGKCGCPTPHNITAIEQYYDALMKSWAQMGGNGFYQSTETSGLTGTAMSAAQVHTYAHLYAWGHKQAQLAWQMHTVEVPNQHGFGWHGMGGTAWGGHIYCPGTLRKNQRAAVLQQANVILTGQHPAPTPPPTPTHNTAPRFMGLLVQGSRGLPVHEWQAQMRHRGWNIAVDGNFGAGTLAVVKEFEALLAKHHWQYVDPQHKVFTTKVDGKIGNCVWHAAWDAPNLT